jgi:hypothetical protein
MGKLDDGPVRWNYLVWLAGPGHDQDRGPLREAQLLAFVGGSDPGSDPGSFAPVESGDFGGWFADEGADAAGGDDQAFTAQGGQRVADRITADTEGLRKGRL